MIRPTARAALLLLALLGISAKVAAAPTDAAKVQAALSEGRSLAARGDHQGAIVAWKRVFELDSRNCAAASEITVSALALHDLSQAEQSARSAVDFCTVDKQAGAAYYNLALVLLEKGDKAAAITAFGHSLDRHDNPYVHKKLAAVDAQAARRYEERMRLRGPFETLAQQLLASEKGRVVALREMDLDKDGKVERIAYICSDDHVVILIEKDTAHRWKMDFQNLIGHPVMGEVQGNCQGDRPDNHWDTREETAIEFSQWLRGDKTEDTWRVAVRRGELVVIEHETRNRDTDKTRSKDLDHPPYKSAAELLDGQIGTQLTVERR